MPAWKPPFPASLCSGIALALAACGGGGDGPASGNTPSAAPDAPACASPAEVTADTVLDGACVYKQAFTITRSDVTLDCNGATIDGRGTDARGIYVDSRGNALRNVTIRNCHLKNQASVGIAIGWSGSLAARLLAYSRDEIYARTPQQVLIENASVDGAGNAGIYLETYASGNTLSHVTVTNSRGPGVYLDASTRGNRIVNSTFTGNGLPRTREAIAIDSSAGNTIAGNKFGGNALAAITLYKNCGENQGPARWQHSDGNLIQDNDFAAENVGVWIASRQSRDLSNWNCGDPSYYAGRYFLDYAQDNQVISNRFSNVWQGVVVEDDNNTVSGNTFSGARSADIVTGAQYRAMYLGRPVSGLIAQDNTYLP
ncbi:right-handed parallel beta-helix repeat-containing protein [Cupriavidus sp. 30B13]|uniref:right-handed parallel beta-helix repeat-containing protein n=1 Tax=Cupriavidus sp. 30B13 TaxID=3384241 RepID=UPI003B920949